MISVKSYIRAVLPWEMLDDDYIWLDTGVAPRYSGITVEEVLKESANGTLCIWVLGNHEGIICTRKVGSRLLCMYLAGIDVLKRFDEMVENLAEHAREVGCSILRFTAAKGNRFYSERFDEVATIYEKEI